MASAFLTCLSLGLHCHAHRKIDAVSIVNDISLNHKGVTKPDHVLLSAFSSLWNVPPDRPPGLDRLHLGHNSALAPTSMACSLVSEHRYRSTKCRTQHCRAQPQRTDPTYAHGPWSASIGAINAGAPTSKQDQAFYLAQPPISQKCDTFARHVRGTIMCDRREIDNG
jgi:hypothetical protein